MRRRLNVGVIVALMFAGLAGSAFAQTGSAQLGGIVQDSSSALIPGSTVTAKNVGTGVALTQITNESGAYSFPVLQPGTYEVSAELPGFKKTVHRDVALPYAGQVRLNFTLEVGAVNQTVDVSVAQESVLRESSASVGDVLSRDKIDNLPMVGNNVLDLLFTLPGLRLSPAGEQFDTVNGLGLNSVNATRDGMSTNDTRFYPEFWGPRTLSTTNISPDLVGEIRLIVSPVDAEIGRGNSQIQISTRSGTNRYSGSASWNVRNSALDANTWANNHTAFADPISGVLSNSTPKNWSNLHEYTIAYGGPIRIPKVYDGTSRTFFYVLWDQNMRKTREYVNTNVLTDTARQGIFRYWEGYNPLGWNPNATNASPSFPLSATTASYIAVDQRGAPVRPPAAPNSTSINPAQPGFVPYSGNLICFSVFGTQRLDGDGNMVPFTPSDCPGGNISTPTGRPAWDNFRPTFDSSGLIRKFLQAMPRANYFGSGDGLNVAQLRWVRRRSGELNLGTNGLPTTIAGASNVGSSEFANRKQLNVKIDHNFNTNHKVAVSYTLQRDDNDDNCGGYPDSICGGTIRRPHVLTINGTSTLTPRMVNEARFGLNYTKNYTYAPWYSPNPEIADAARQYMLPAGNSVRTPGYQYFALVSSSIGNISGAASFMNTNAAQVFAENPLYNWADTLSWSTGKHAFKFGVDWRLPRSTGNGSAVPDPQVWLGNASSSTASPFGVAANFNTPGDAVGYLPGLLNSAPNNQVTAARTNATNLLYYLNGSVGVNGVNPGGGVNHNYWITSSANQTQGYWDDVSTQGQRLRKQINQEWAVFAKDDFKITSRLTLNLGLRWEYYSSPFIDGGFTTTMQDYGWGAFGATRAAQTTLDKFNEDPFSILYHPGNLYLTGYGSSTTNPLSCQTGVQQNSLLPVSTCDPSALSIIKFVGPGSPNPSDTAMPENFNNFGPAVGFAYTLPWFGEGKTTIRGGYQQTFGAASTNRSAGIGGVEGIIANAPGATTPGSLSTNINAYQNILSDRAIGLVDIKALVPMTPNLLTPGSPVNVYGRSFAPQVYDPKLVTPYTQNLTLSVTRQINRQLTVDMRYTGTLGRKQLGSFDINNNNVYYNPELFQALTDARAGTCTASSPAYKANYTDKGISPCDINGDPVFLDQLLAGLNINNTTTGFGAVGTVTGGIFQSGAQHLRRNVTFQQNLSRGNFDSVADSLIALNPTTVQGRQLAPPDPNRPGSTLGGIALIAQRNGCDRIANNYTMVQQTSAGGAQVPNSGAAIPLRCFPEDFLTSNSQFSGVTYNTNSGRTNYHSLQVQLTARPIQGVNVQATWIWARSLFLPTSGYIDPSNRNLNYTVQNINPHSIRMNGTVELPIGPNKLLFPNTTGWVARLLERWQTSFIFNGASGTPTSFNPARSHFYAASGYDVVSPNWAIPKAHVTWNGDAGTMYPGNKYAGVTDPQCTNPSVVAATDRMGTNLQAVCDLFALASRNPDGTTGELLLQYPMPGKVGSLGRGNIYYFGQWSLDMNASKTFQLGENKSIQIRMDATNVLNHATPNQPNLDAEELGRITGKGNQVRQFQGQLRLSF
jgi:hypothetical protein